MKHPHCLRVVTLVAATFAGSLSAQTNTLPASGNVGIGTLSPALPFEVDGPGYLQSQFVATGSGSAGGIALKGFNGSSFQQFEFQSVPSNATPASSLIIYDRTHGIYDLTINPNGNVGIGTTNPQGLLHLHTPNGVTNQLILSKTNGPDATVGILFADDAWAWNGSAGSASIGAADDGAYGGYLAFSTTLDGSGSGGVPTERMRITNSGNVGIGTATPAAALNVVGNVGREVARFQGSTDVTNYRNFISIYTTNPGFWWELSNQDSSGNGSTNGLAFRENSAGNGDPVRMYLQQGGDVGIGTTTPAYPLSVNGTVEAKEVIVQTGWSDYVFNPAYRLAPLSKVEAQIKADGHLPGIPSAKEVAAHGVNLGDMEAKLLAKVEELTLRQIDEEKRIGALEQENQVLEGENSRLEEMISKP
jgi:hypothetical protein